MKRIQLRYTTRFAIVDDDDFEALRNRKWYLAKTGYAVAWDPASFKVVLMHRIIMKAKKGQQIDHTNRDKLDNRKTNLRFATNPQQAINKGKVTTIPSTSRFKGVWFAKSRNKWGACTSIRNRTRFIGHFETEIQAALAYNEAVRRIHGNFAYLNPV